MKILHVVGARPNFMKVAPVMAAIRQRSSLDQMLVHTGQHYDANMSEIFFQQLGMPRPDVNLEVGSGSHTVQTANVMIRFEETVLQHKPDLVLVYGDVNSTVAAALVCSKHGIQIGHVEAGLRSGDRRMPEEINRLVTDQISDLLFTPSLDGNENLAREGIPAEKIHCVGNVMIDTLVRLLPQAKMPAIGVEERYVLVTLHRPSNVDDADTLRSIVETLSQISRELQIIFPIHPRTRRRIAEFELDLPAHGRLLLTEPLGYLEFLALQRHATAVVTDSGGIQEETTYLGVPCLTVRENTERPITCEIGTNVLCGRDMDSVRREVARIIRGEKRRGTVPPLWDGHAGERVAKILVEQLS